MKSQQTLRPEDIDRIAEIDSVRQSTFYRVPDRPDGRFVKSPERVRPEVRRAQGRLRTARYRSELDRIKKPTLEQIGKSLAVALVTSRLSELTGAERGIVQRMLHDLQARGFEIEQAKRVLRRLRKQLLDPADRDGEPTESTGETKLPF